MLTPATMIMYNPLFYPCPSCRLQFYHCRSTIGMNMYRAINGNIIKIAL